MEWKKIEGYENYSVSKDGEVRNDKTERVLKKTNNKYGYEYVNLYKNGKSKTFSVHRLVAIAFISNLDNLPCIDHINTIRNDNRVENLRWCTHKENSNNSKTLEKFVNRRATDETKRKLREAKKGKQLSEYHKQKISEAKKNMSEETKEKMGRAKKGKNNPQCKKVILLNTGEVFDYIGQASKKYKVTVPNICQCCKGKQKSAGKHPETGEKLVWMYMEDYLREED